MPSLEMGKAFKFTREFIDLLIGDDDIGNYALGYINDNNLFVVEYVGRSDTSLKRRLIEHLNDLHKYTYFKFKIQISIKDAYILECKNYHDFGGTRGMLFNDRHPDAPNNYSLSCPFCAGWKEIKK